ncbi:MAG: phosphopentomutase [Terriglobales bacterium]
MAPFARVVLIVLDGVGAGALPDAARYGDAGSDTLGNLQRRRPMRLPHLAALGLGNLKPLRGLPPAAAPRASFGRCAILSEGKDTTAGHWEMAGIILEHGFPTYPLGFPRELIAEFEARIGRGTLGNLAASGTEIIERLGAEHMRTGRPIVYTSADSVFQVAAHEEIIATPELYRICAIARDLLRGPHQVGRVIARPFTGSGPGDFRRTRHRHDFAIEPPAGMLLDRLAEHGIPVLGVGKISDIFLGRGIAEHLAMESNADGMGKTLALLANHDRGMIFVNLVDFDMLYGHRNDVEGFARALEEFDAELGGLLAALGTADLLILTADHGCDPTTPSTDHSREYAPLLAYAPGVAGRGLGTRASLADIGETIAENFAVPLHRGQSFLPALRGLDARPGWRAGGTAILPTAGPQ